MSFHRVLQLLAFKIVHHLVRRGLPHVQDGLARDMLRLDLVTHRALPALGERTLDCSPERRRAGAPEVLPLRPAWVG